jgi:hypothetical protein
MTTIAALADVDMCNMALGHLGISVNIQSINPPDQTTQAAVLAFWYPICRNELLQSAPWNFAYNDVNLAQEPVPSQTGPQLGFAAPGWQYSYQYPNDCLQPIAVTTLAGQRFGPQFWLGYWWPSVGMTLTIPKIPYKVMESQVNPGQLCILCDFLATPQNPLYLFYIQCVTNTAQFDPMFCNTLSYLLGWRAGTQLRADKQKVQDCMAGYKEARLQTLAQHLNANQQDLERDSPSIQARW